MTPTWPDDAKTIRAWALGDAVDVDRLVNELEEWSNYFASTAALWPATTVRQNQVTP